MKYVIPRFKKKNFYSTIFHPDFIENFSNNFSAFIFIRFCAVADELNDYIYMIGGYNQRYKAYQYKISTNTWSGMSDSSTYYSVYVSTYILYKGKKINVFDI